MKKKITKSRIEKDDMGRLVMQAHIIISSVWTSTLTWVLKLGHPYHQPPPSILSFSFSEDIQLLLTTSVTHEILNAFL